MVERGLLHRFEQSGPLTWLLAACAGWAVLLWLTALLGLGNAVAPTPRIAADVQLPQARPASPDRIGPLAQYAEAAARPLFTSDRRPRSFLATGPNGDAAEGVQTQSLDFILTGVLISPQLRMAFLQPTGGGETIRVREGTSPAGASGWRLVDVQARRAVFTGSEGDSSLELRVFGDATPGKSAAPDTRVSAQSAPTDDATLADPDAIDAAPVPLNEAARVDAIRQRIQARRAQLQGNQPNNPAPTPSRDPSTR